MHALSLWQPWASLIACGAKTVETRSWSTAYRGALAIHAAMHPIDRQLIQTWPYRQCLLLAGFRAGETQLVASARLPRGCIVAIANLTSVRSTHDWRPGDPQELAFGDYAPGRYAWCLSDIQALKDPIPVKGQRLLFPLDQEMEREILRRVQ